MNTTTGHTPRITRSDRRHRHHHAHRSLAEINSLIERSALSPAAQARAKELFHRLGEAEAAIHQIPIEKIHLHEVGALDSIIDIVGAVFALEWFHADRIISSPLNVGGGMVHSAHGHFPVPAPATVKLLAGAPVYSSGVQSELVTPTGALLVTSYATSLRSSAGDDDRARRLRRRRSRPAEHAERAARSCRREHRSAAAPSASSCSNARSTT